MIKITQELKDRILLDSNNGVPAEEISKYSGMSPKMVCYHRQKWGYVITRRVKFSDEEVLLIIKQYSEGLNMAEIAKNFKSFNTSIRRVLISNGVKTRDISQTLSNKENMFSTMSSEAQYWIGFLAADGCIHSRKNSSKYCVSLGCAEKDAHHLKKYAEFVKSRLFEVYNKRFNIIEYRVSFSNKNIYEYLVSLGLSPQKSKTLKFNIELTPDIVRGLFDGDGHITKDGKTFTIATASLDLRNQLECFFTKNNIESKGYIQHNKTGDLYIFAIYGKSNLIKVYHLLYDNATIFLERKKSRFNVN